MKSIFSLFFICCLLKRIESTDLIEAKYLKEIHIELFPIFISQTKNQFKTNLELTKQLNSLNLSPKDNYKELNATILRSNIEKIIDGKLIIGDEIEVSFYFKSDPNKSQATLQFFSSTTHLYKSCQLALPFVFEDKRLSLIHQYYDRGIINRLAFSIVRNENDGSVYFGGIPNHATVNRTHSYCNVIGRNNYWDCSITKMELKNKTHIKEYKINKTNNYVLFDTNTDFLFAPSTFMDFLYDYYTSLNITVYNTTTANSYGKRQLYASYSNKFEANLHITIDNFVYDLNLGPLWMCYELHCNLEIIENPKGEMWTFTIGFFDKYNIMFDYDNKTVNFYSLTGVKPKENKNRANYMFSSVINTKSIAMTNVFLLICGFGLMYMVKGTEA